MEKKTNILTDVRTILVFFPKSFEIVDTFEDGCANESIDNRSQIRTLLVTVEELIPHTPF